MKRPVSHSRQTHEQMDTDVLLVKHGSTVLMLCLSTVGVSRCLGGWVCGYHIPGIWAGVCISGWFAFRLG